MAYIGQDYERITIMPEYPAVDRIRLWTDDNMYYQAPSAQSDFDALTGKIIEAECPYATQAMVDAMLVSLQGLTYQPFEATNAFLNPLAELGDSVTIGGITSVIGEVKTTFSNTSPSNVKANGTEDEQTYKYESKAERQLKQKTADNTANIAVNSSAITAEVTRATSAESGLNENLSSKITQTASEIRIDLKDYADTAVGDHAAEQQKYIRYNANGLELGEEGSMAQARLTNTKLSFQDVNGAEKAYIGQDPNDGNVYKFFVINGHIVNQLELGDHWLLIASGSENDYRLTFKWKA